MPLIECINTIWESENSLTRQSVPNLDAIIETSNILSDSSYAEAIVRAFARGEELAPEEFAQKFLDFCYKIYHSIEKLLI